MALAPTLSDDIAAGPPHPYRWTMLAGVWLLYFAFAVAIASMAPLVYRLMADLGMHRGEMGTVLAAWQLTYIFCSVPCGGLLDRFGPRRMMFTSVLVIAASVALRGLATDYVTLLLAVMVFGLGGPLISSGAPKVVSLWFTGKERGLAMGIYFTGNATGGIVAVALTNSVFLPAIGGDWRDLMSGYALFIVAVGAIWLAISAHPASRDLEARLKAEEKRRSMDVFLELIRDPVVRLVLLLGLFILFYNHGMNHWLPDLLRSYGMTPSEAGYWAAVPTLFGMVASLSLPRMATPDKRFAILLGLFVCAAGATVLVWSASGPMLAVGLILQGMCRGAMTSISILLLIESGDGKTSRVGAASGLYFSVGEVGGVLGPMSMGALAHATGDFDASLFMMFGVACILMLILMRLRTVQERH
ncbi:MAG: MFS transporter [Rhodospirillaceae bacterium]|nr:MAG: MFS transporter [Rhodospirillaceae bacterium]